MGCNDYKTETIFFTYHSHIKYCDFTVNSDGTISLDIDPQYVLGTDSGLTGVKWVKKSDENKFIFSNAQEILGVSDTHGKK